MGLWIHSKRGTTTRRIGHTILLFMLCRAGVVAKYNSCTNGRNEFIGDLKCDKMNNNDECAYDGGDCCPCTNNRMWFDDTVTDYFETFCRDPNSGCLDPRADIYPNCTHGAIPDIGDGRCDVENNNKECNFDEGDCCECTRAGKGSSFSFCVDPDAACYNPAAATFQSSCINGTLGHIGNGDCNDENNVEECGYDGGDCCMCSCTDGEFYSCGSNGFSCVDPDVIYEDIHLCVESPFVIPVCPAGRQLEWVVENTFQARALAEAVRCSGGSFHVTWKSNVILAETISIFNETFLNVTSADADNTIVGDGKSRLFAVVNASLHLSKVTLSNGNASYGGAIAASHSRLTFDGVVFTGNVASSGGALYLSHETYASFGGETANTTFTENGATSGGGGALYVTGGSHVSWTGNSVFSENSCSGYGGALFIDGGSSAVWTATSHFLRNSAILAGGALMVIYGSKVTWAAESHFFANRASNGGGLCVLVHSNATWLEETTFSANVANSFGGAILVDFDCSITWTAESHFLGNGAGYYGGAVMLVGEGCRATWTAIAIFYNNSAQDYGGAVYASYGASLSWSKNTSFIDNIAGTGGAIFVKNGVRAEWSGETSFISNRARSNGGAVGSRAFNSASVGYANNEMSIIAMKGATSFVNNTCGANGGGMALVQSLTVLFENENIIFSENSAGSSGGAVFIGGTGIGTVFANVIFLSNSAQIGGGVRATASGTTMTLKYKKQVANPTTFDRCSFVGNVAFGTGGAIDSASGKDVFVHTLFEGNVAKLGGALRLAGKASVDNCSFNENTSELDGGPAVSNAGFMSNVTTSYFHNNIFNCDPQTFLEFIKTVDTFKTVCDECPDTCFGCSFGKAQGSPTCTLLKEAGMEHATSKGGNTTVEELQIDKGYWRATNTSREIFECFNTKACIGGLTGGSNYCLQGYEGPYCSVCIKNYAPGLSFTCRECSNRWVDISIAAVLVVLALAVGMAIAWHLVSADKEGCGRGIVDRVMRRIPIHSVKIIITVWQILTQFASVSNVTFPNVYQTFLNGVNFLNFDLSWVVSARCFIEVDFHDRLLCTTMAPVVIMGLLGVTYAITMHKHRGSPEMIFRKIRQKHVSMVLLVTFAVYSSVSSVVFQMFACDKLDTGKRYLRADYTIECDSYKHRGLQIYAGLMIILYPVGIPVLYAGLLFSNRNILREENGREESFVVRSFSDLWKPYKPQRFYYEVIECVRRILLAGVVVFIYPNTASQIAVTFAIAVAFVFVSEAMAPYKSYCDAWTSQISHAIVFASMYLALLLKVDVSGERYSSQQTFGVILVGVHGCMILAVMVQAVVMALSLRTTKQLQDPLPSFRRSSI